MYTGLTSLLDLLELNPAATSSFVYRHLQTQFTLLDDVNQMLETVAGNTGTDARRKSYAWLDLRHGHVL